MTKIIRVIPREDYCLEVILDNDSCILLSLKKRLETIRFGMLADYEFFKRVTTDGVCLSWDGKIEISLSEVFQLAQR